MYPHPTTRSAVRAVGAPFALLLAAALPAQNLIRDLNGPAADGNGDPGPGVVMNGVAYFVARDEYGPELWRSDGTVAGTWRVKDIEPGPLGPGIRDLTVVGNQLFFAADSSTYGVELWVTDGTTVGTRMVRDLFPSHNFGGSPNRLTAFGGKVWFWATIGDGSVRLCTSDGTAPGTGVAPFQIFGPQPLAVMGNRLYVAGRTGAAGYGLYSTDGTLAGTALVTAAVTGVTQMAAAGGQLFFAASRPSPATGNELFVTDGTTVGTRLVADIRSGSQSSTPSSFQVLGSLLVFTAADATSGREPWRSDGTAAGTYRLADIRPGATASTFNDPAVANGLVFFETTDLVVGRELWVTDGTVAGTMPLDIEPGAGGSVPQGMTAALGGVVFRASVSGHGSELWFSDGTLAGTREIELLPGIVGGSPFDFTAMGSRVLFSSSTTGFGGAERELFLTDGTVAGTGELVDLWPVALSGSDPKLLKDLGGQLFFAANAAPATAQPWITNGTAAGTTALSATVRVGDDAVLWNGRIWFEGIDPGIPGWDLYSTDGTAAGTVREVDVATASGVGGPERLTPAGNRLFFVASAPGTGSELHVTDGTQGGTLLIDIHPGGSSAPDELTAVGNRVFFVANDGSSGREIGVSDGTVVGTRIIDTLPGVASSVPVELTAFNGELFYAARPMTTGRTALYHSDGTVAGTGVLPVPSGNNSQIDFPRSLTVAGSLLYMVAREAGGDELWATDGTVAGTYRVAELTPGGMSPTFYDMVAAGSRLYFFANDNRDLTGIELWTSDGTAAGTYQVVDLMPGDGSGAYLGTLTPVPGSTDVVFVGSDGIHGLQLYYSDGTPGGTRQLGLIAGNGAGAAQIGGLTPIGTELYFWCDDGGIGPEPWVVSMAGGPPRPLAANYGQGCPGTDGVIPAMHANGLPFVGNLAFSADVRDAYPNSLAAMVLGPTPAFLRISPTCRLLVQGDTRPFVQTNVHGVGVSPLPIPNSPALLGARLYGQYAVIDPNGALSGIATLSEGLVITIGR